MRPGLYIHLPFCATVCPYCDFSVLVGGDEKRTRFVEGMSAEIGLWAASDELEVGSFDTIYLGGGTPSLLAPAQLERLLSALRAGLDIGSRAWIFLEANPEDVTRESVRAWVDLGVRFVSLGVQSFDDDELRFLGRLHDARRARTAVELALGAGFTTVSLDLIYGLPGQSEGAWRASLESAVALGPGHMSCYQLTVHERTVFGVRERRGELTQISDGEQADMFLLTHRFLADQDYSGYEVSNFARSESHQSRHNMKYWDHTPYLGLGPSAHSFAGRRRWWNRRSLASWQTAVEAGEMPIEGSETLDDADFALERVMLGLRTRAGLDIDVLRTRYGLDLESPVSAPRVESLLDRGLLDRDGASLRPTLAGLAIADTLALELARTP